MILLEKGGFFFFFFWLLGLFCLFFCFFLSLFHFMKGLEISMKLTVLFFLFLLFIDCIFFLFLFIGYADLFFGFMYVFLKHERLSYTNATGIHTRYISKYSFFI